MSDLQATREAFDRSDISEVRWIERSKNIADSVTKFATCDVMIAFLHSKKLEYGTIPWVLRDAKAQVQDTNYGPEKSAQLLSKTSEFSAPSTSDVVNAEEWDIRTSNTEVVPLKRQRSSPY